MGSEFLVEKGVPAPKPRFHRCGGGPGGRPKYPFGQMEVGDSFAVADTEVFHKVQAAASNFGRKHGSAYACRKVGDAYRVWRVA